jgi:hypothetical protein
MVQLHSACYSNTICLGAILLVCGLLTDTLLLTLSVPPTVP